MLDEEAIIVTQDEIKKNKVVKYKKKNKVIASIKIQIMEQS